MCLKVCIASHLLWSICYVTLGSAQVLAGTFFYFYLPLLKLGSNLWIGLWVVTLGIFTAVYAMIGKWTRSKQIRLIYVSLIILLANIANLVILEVGEWNILVSEDVKILIDKGYLETLEYYGRTWIEYISEAAVMVSIIDLHFTFLTMYERYKKNQKPKPDAESDEQLTDQEYVIPRVKSDLDDNEVIVDEDGEPYFTLTNPLEQSWVFKGETSNSNDSTNSSSRNRLSNLTNDSGTNNELRRTPSDGGRSSRKSHNIEQPVVVIENELATYTDRQLQYMASFSRTPSPIGISQSSSTETFFVSPLCETPGAPKMPRAIYSSSPVKSPMSLSPSMRPHGARNIVVIESMPQQSSSDVVARASYDQATRRVKNVEFLKKTRELEQIQNKIDKDSEKEIQLLKTPVLEVEVHNASEDDNTTADSISESVAPPFERRRNMSTNTEDGFYDQNYYEVDSDNSKIEEFEMELLNKFDRGKEYHPHAIYSTTKFVSSPPPLMDRRSDSPNEGIINPAPNSSDVIVAEEQKISSDEGDLNITTTTEEEIMNDLPPSSVSIEAAVTEYLPSTGIEVIILPPPPPPPQETEEEDIILPLPSVNTEEEDIIFLPIPVNNAVDEEIIIPPPEKHGNFDFGGEEFIPPPPEVLEYSDICGDQEFLPPPPEESDNFNETMLRLVEIVSPSSQSELIESDLMQTQFDTGEGNGSQLLEPEEVQDNIQTEKAHDDDEDYELPKDDLDEVFITEESVDDKGNGDFTNQQNIEEIPAQQEQEDIGKEEGEQLVEDDDIPAVKIVAGVYKADLLPPPDLCMVGNGNNYPLLQDDQTLPILNDDEEDDESDSASEETVLQFKTGD